MGHSEKVQGPKMQTPQSSYFTVSPRYLAQPPHLITHLFLSPALPLVYVSAETTVYKKIKSKTTGEKIRLYRENMSDYKVLSIHWKD